MEYNNTHLAGEYFVAAELYRRGFSVGMTIGNAKSIDILAYKNTKATAIQVKAIKDKKSVGWPMLKNKLVENVIYIFVNLNYNLTPEYYICYADEVQDKIKEYTTRGIVTLNSLRAADCIDKWNKIESITII